MNSTGLRSVDRLVITFLVDNSIEWLTKLPAGFTHELPQHLQQRNPPLHRHPVTGVPVLDFDGICCGAHGFSALIETQISGEEAHLTLFDTGPDTQSLARNVKAMQVPVERISRVITSHWHADHTGGLLSLLDLRKDQGPKCIVDCHPDRPISRGMARGPLYDTVFGALPDDPSFQQIEAAGGVVETHVDGHAVAGGGVWVSGEIPRITSFEGGIPGGMRWVEEGGGHWIADELIMDERYTAIDVVGKGLVIFSACSHAGIVNVVRDAVAKFSRPVHMIIGGLHLSPPDCADRIEPTVAFLSQQMTPAPNFVLPMHCSGFQSKVELEKAFGEGCVPAGVGMKVEVLGDRQFEARLLPTKVVI
ncbi:7, 8-dihydropterin-6-methyl-4--aminobenzene-5'-phosphate synthase [Favolaschia claudopus]|uniref:7, 8-dihydropterin-6-methyl-4--aminobenzene-5'-phosphate synthase n=1 Tax=Favolaschia claudopus TaxID=2862362 RepID=A0AAW0A8Y1_9AGAR